MPGSLVIVVFSLGLLDPVPERSDVVRREDAEGAVFDDSGKATLRHGGRLYHIGVGRAHARTRVLLLVQDTHVRVINAATGELLRELALDTSRNYQPTGKPRRPLKGQGSRTH